MGEWRLPSPALRGAHLEALDAREAGSLIKRSEAEWRGVLLADNSLQQRLAGNVRSTRRGQMHGLALLCCSQ